MVNRPLISILGYLIFLLFALFDEVHGYSRELLNLQVLCLMTEEKKRNSVVNG
jgi:hypothetical protein